MLRTLIFMCLTLFIGVGCQTNKQTVWCIGDPLGCGWEMAGPGNFVAEGNELKATGGMGLLWYTRKEYKDFLLELQWRVDSPEQNSGVFVRFPDPGDDPWVAVNQGYELQICDAGGEKTRTGSVYSFQDSDSIPTNPPGEWNNYAIQVIGQTYTVSVNGVVVNEFIGDRGLQGYVGLQNHDDHSPVRFRNIRATEL